MRTYYPSINGIRAISIIMVVIGHLSLHNNIIGPLDDYPILVRPFLQLLSDAHLGVSIFFVVSGFLITKVLLAEYKKKSTISFRTFYLKRILRIFPAYFALLFFYIVLQIFGQLNLSTMSWLTALTFTKYFNWSLDWETAHLWSLSVEEHFYLLWPLVIWGGLKNAKIGALLAIILVAYFRIYNSYFSTDWLNTFSIFLRADAIAVGCLFALYEKAIIEKLKQHWNLIFLLSVAFIFSATYIWAWSKPFLSHPLCSFLGEGNLSLPSYLAVAIILFYSMHAPQNLWHNVMKSPLLNNIGIGSYSIYLWQQFFISGRDGWAFAFPNNIFMLALVACASYYFIERPFLNLKQKIVKD